MAVNTRGATSAAGRARARSSSVSSRPDSTAAAQVPQPAAPAPILDAATAAQIAAVGPALAAIAASLGVPPALAPAPSVHSQPQPEDEPGDGLPAGTGEGGNGKEERKNLVDLRNIKIAPFGGTVKGGNFDAKARDFREELDEQISDAQLFSGRQWNDEVKKAILKHYLTGMARRWFQEWRVANPMASYRDAGDALVHEFRPVLLGVDIADKIKHERKRWNETYREYSDRLLQMADALEGGKAVPANARHALVAFIRNAYPKYTDFLETKVNLDTDRPEGELKSAISVLARKAGTDGRLPDKALKPKTVLPAGQQGKGKAKGKPAPARRLKHSKKPEAEKKRPAEANAAMVERKKRLKGTNYSNSRGSIVCYKCGTMGHTAAFCQTYLKPKTNEEGEAGGSAQLAEEDFNQDDAAVDDEDQEEDEDDE